MVEAVREQIDRSPQPLALALGRVVRARTLPERLDAAIKGAEVVTRYVAMLALASYSARDGGAIEERSPLGGFSGPLSFGHYMNLILEIVAGDVDHPLGSYLRPLFRPTKKGTDPKAAASLKALLKLRNDEGHDLRHIDEARAMMIARDFDPVGTLRQSVDALQSLLQMPLLIVEDQRIRGGVITATCLILRGEGTPFPEDLDLKGATESIRSPYVVTRHGLLDLSPGMIWDIVERQQAFGVFFLDKVMPDAVAYKAVADGSLIEFSTDGAAVVAERLVGAAHAIEEIDQATGVSLSTWLRDPAAALTATEAAEAPQAPAEPDEIVDVPMPRTPLADEPPQDPAAVVEAEPHKPDKADTEPEPPIGDPRLTRDAIIRWLTLEDRTPKEVAAHLDVPVLWVKKAAALHGLDSLLSNAATGLVATPEQVETYEAGTTTGEIAAEMMRTPIAALKALVAGGAELRPEDSARIGGRQPRITRGFLKREFNENKRTMEQIGDEVGLTREMIRNYLNRYGLPTRVDRTEDPAEKLSEPVLRQLYVVQGLSLDAIADRADLRPGQVADLAARYELARPRVYERHGLTHELLTELYIGQRKSIATIAKELDVSQQTVSTALAKHNIPLRSRHEAVGRGLHEKLTPDYLAARRADGASVAQIAEENSTTDTTVRKYLAEAGLLDPAGPDPRFDDLLTADFLTREYLDAGLSQGEFCAKYDVQPAEVRLRMQLAGLEVPRRRNTQLDHLPTTASIRTATEAGQPTDFPISEAVLSRMYLDEGRSSGDLAATAGTTVDDAVAALCAAGIELRLGLADLLSEPYLRRRYLDDAVSAAEIARDVGATPATVTKRLKKYGIEVRGRGESSARNHCEPA